MRLTLPGSGFRRLRTRIPGSLFLIGVGLCLGLLPFGVGCPDFPLPVGPSDNGNGNVPSDGTDDEVEAELVSFSQNFSLSALDEPVSVIYTVTGQPGAVSGVYVPVADASAGAGAIGDPVVIQAILSAGSNQAFNFDPQLAGVGNYRVGISVTVDGVSELFLSEGVLQVQGSPDPRFILPLDAITEVMADADVAISFDAGDPEGNVQWRLFFLTASDSRNDAPDELGTQLQTGSGNFGSFTFSTIGLEPGDYELGVSATDTGKSIAATVDDGDLERIITIGSETGPGPIIRVIEEEPEIPSAIAVLAPADTSVSLFLNEPFTIQISASVGPLGATGLIDIFYDLDDNFSNGFTLLPNATGLPSSTTSLPLPTDLPAGTYFIGASINDGINPTAFTYATGTITVVRTPTLTVTDPSTNLPIAPAAAVTVAWTTNVPATAGLMDIFAQTLNAQGEAFGVEIPILAPTGPTSGTAGFSSASSGLFQLFVRITFNAEFEVAPLVVSAPQSVRVSSLPPVLWLGSLADGSSSFDGAIFEGVQPEDNAGASFSGVGDVNGDGFGEFLVGARYGKSFFANPSGVGPGEAYLLYGSPTKLSGVFSLNSVGTPSLTGVTFVGIRTPQDSDETDGMSSIGWLPDIDGDERNELIFGFPNTDSRGHNVDAEQNGVVDPRSLATLEREDQFLSGGIVIVSSRNSVLGNPDPDLFTQVINLDLVGQDFDQTCVGPEPSHQDVPEGFGEDVFYEDVFNPDSDPPCDGSCGEPASGGGEDANRSLSYGFVSALSADYFSAYVESGDLFGGSGSCTSPARFSGAVFECGLAYCTGVSSCTPFSPGLHDSVDNTGFYVTYLGEDDAGDLIRNQAREPLGARILGVGIGDNFGTSLTLSNALGTGAGNIIVSAPGRSARGILLGPLPTGCDDSTLCGGEIDGLTSSLGSAKTNPGSGVAYMFDVRSLWTDSGAQIPPKPHQYIVGEASHCGGPVSLIPNIDAVRIAGFSGDEITNMIGILDFNGDARNDFAIGAPDANGGQGRIYIAYRREEAIEGDYVLEKLALDPNSDPERLDGMFVMSNSLDALGSSLATGFDFNGDGAADLVVGSPAASGGVGEVIILFGQSGVISGLNGVSVQDLLQTERTADGRPVAARITGNPLDNGQFGFNVANAGDVNGDGIDDLLIAAPNATPRFDDTPMDSEDSLSEPGVDVDFDGIKDDVSGPLGIADNVIDSNDNLDSAGVVYLVYGSNRLDQIPATDVTISIDQLGNNLLRGFIIAGRRAGDRIGGGDAGDSAQGGIVAKLNRGRSFGLASAGDIDGDGRKDILIGSILADPRRDPNTGNGVENGGEAYLIYGSSVP